MAVLARGPEDLILDGVLTKITAWRTAQIAAAALLNPVPVVTFDIFRDRQDSFLEPTVPTVTLELVDSTPKDKGGKINQDFIAKYRAFCFVPTNAENSVAWARLYYLQAQIRAALLDLTDSDLDMAAGTCGFLRLGAWTVADFDDKEIEQTLIGGSWEFSVDCGYTAASATDRALSDLVVTAGRWSAAYHFT